MSNPGNDPNERQQATEQIPFTTNMGYLRFDLEVQMGDDGSVAGKWKARPNVMFEAQNLNALETFMKMLIEMVLERMQARQRGEVPLDETLKVDMGFEDIHLTDDDERSPVVGVMGWWHKMDDVILVVPSRTSVEGAAQVGEWMGALLILIEQGEIERQQRAAHVSLN